MKLYEMLHFMGDEFSSLFMALRTVTQRPIKYFMERKERIWELMDVDYPEMRGEKMEAPFFAFFCPFCTFPLRPLLVNCDIWESGSIESLLCLMSHQDDIEEDQLMKNAITAVFFMRALQAANYFERYASPAKRLRGDKTLR